jgi:phage terminase large subunit
MLKMTARKKVIQGGTSAGKTYGIIPILIDIATKRPRIKITVVAETVPAVKEGAVTIFKDVMEDTARWIQERWNASDREYTFANGSKIQFKSFDTIGKAKAAGKRDILFLNEANHIPFAIADALMIRSKETWIDFNPDNEFWVHKEVLHEPNSEFLLLNYHDNEACPKETIEDLLIKQKKAQTSAYWANWCRVYIDGEIGSLQGVIFTNWRVIDTIPVEATLIGYGLDFGYSNDPTAIVEIYKYNDKRIINELCYQKGLSNRDISKFITTPHTVYCDSAEPKSIAELRAYGIRAEAVIKGTDSINFGIQIMQEQDYLVTSKSVNVISELRKYAWDTDRKTGSNLNKPIDMFNHSIDAIRYHEMMSLGKPNKGKYLIG